MKHRVAILEQVERAIKLMDEMTYSDCECDKANPGGHCPLCSRHASVVSALGKIHKLTVDEP